tara:strand:+ start:2215 stop:2505 length:291 start_codon:yes stop_codon:yes gene_type:complete
MEIIKNDMTKEEIQHYVELLMSVPHGSFAKLTMPVLISMHNGLMENAMAYNTLEDKYRELLQKGTYKPLAKQHKRKPRGKKNTAMKDAFNKGSRDL